MTFQPDCNNCSDLKETTSGLLRFHASKWDRGKFECQVGCRLLTIQYYESKYITNPDNNQRHIRFYIIFLFQVFDFGSTTSNASDYYSCLDMKDAREVPHPMVSATFMLDVISKPIIEVFPVTTTLVKVSHISDTQYNNNMWMLSVRIK